MNEEATSVRGIRPVWVFVLFGALALVGWYLCSLLVWPPAKGYWPQAVYALLSLEVVIGAYLYGVGGLSSDQPGTPTPSQGMLASARSLVLRQSLKVATEPPLGPPMQRKSRGTQRETQASDNGQATPGA